MGRHIKKRAKDLVLELIWAGVALPRTLSHRIGWEAGPSGESTKLIRNGQRVLPVPGL